MKTLLLIALVLLCVIPVRAGNFFKDYLKNRFPIVFVNNIPAQATNTIAIVSTRFFKPDENFNIKRGIHPRFLQFYFVAAIQNDTAYIKHLEDPDEMKNFLAADRDFLVYVDGHGKTFGQTIERGFELTERFNINMLVFDWPSDYLALRKTVYSADEVSASFVKAMRTFNALYESYYSNSSVSVMFHSMGNRILKNISSSYLIEKMPRHLFSNIIINAAAVKQQNHARWVERLNIQKRIFITSNNRDFNLKGAAIIRMAEQLGIGNRQYARNAFYVNFSDFATLEHNLFLGRSQLEKTKPQIFRFYDLAFHGKQVSLNEDAGFQILSPSDKSFLFSVR